jgi:hypothetical protein
MLFSAGSAPAQPTVPQPFSFSINGAILTGPAQLGDIGSGPRPLAAVADVQGIVSRFIANEVIFRGSQPELSAFLAKYGGQVVQTIQPPAAAGAPVPFFQPASLVKLDASRFGVQNLPSDTAKLGFSGAHQFSSSTAASLAALVASEEALGTKVALNFVHEGTIFSKAPPSRPTSTRSTTHLNGLFRNFDAPGIKRVIDKMF